MIKRSVLFFALLAFATTPAFADIIAGKVQSVNPDKNWLELIPNDNSKACKVVWNENLDGVQKLENAQVGDELALEAKKGFLTRKYYVKAVNPGDAIDQANDRAVGDTTPNAKTLATNAKESLQDAGETIGAGINRAGRKIGNAFDRDDNKIDNASDRLEDKADDAGDTIKRNTRDAKESIQDSADDAGDAMDRKF